MFSTTTNGLGGFLVEHLPPGEYGVVVDAADIPPGMFQTGDPDATNDGTSRVTLANGEADLDQDFGYRGIGSIGDHVWYDLDDDGVQDPDEPGLAGVDLTGLRSSAAR